MSDTNESKTEKAVTLRKRELPESPFQAEKSITLAKSFVTEMGLQPIHTSSVLRSVEAYAAVKRMILRQAKMKPSERKALIQSKNPLTDGQLAEADLYVVENFIPYSLLALIENRVYPRAEGVKLRLLADPRIFVRWELVEKKVDRTTDNYICSVTVIAHFANGETYPATGCADRIELQARRSKSTVPDSFVEMIAETRAHTRATKYALPLSSSIADEVNDGLALEGTEDVGEVERRKMEEIPGNKLQLISYSKRVYNINVPEVLALLNVLSMDEIDDIPAAWEKIKAAMDKSKVDSAKVVEGEIVSKEGKQEA